MQTKKIISDVIIKKHVKAPVSAPPPKTPPPAAARIPDPAPFQSSPAPAFKKYPEKEQEQQSQKTKFKPISTKPKTPGMFKNFRVAGVILFLGAFVVTTAALIAVKSSKVEVIITPKATALAINKSVLLSRPAAAGNVEFSSVALSYPMSGQFSSVEKKSVESKAQGTVVIYNSASKDPQVLIASTRLETPDGKIYRIPSAVIIPGTKTENGKIIPGSKEVVVSADKPGPEYNIGFSDFTIPGFKGTPKYKTVFARSKTEMTGGYIGNSQIVTKNAVDAAAAELISESNKNLKDIISKKLPDGTMLIPGTEEFTVIGVESEPKIGMPLGDGQKFEIKINAEARGAIVKETDFVKAVTKSDMDPASLGGGEIRIKNKDELSFKITGYTYDTKSMKIDLRGNVQAEASMDIEEVKRKLTDGHASNAGDVLELIPEAFRAELKYRPFWAGSLPGKLLDPMSAGHIDIQIVSR